MIRRLGKADCGGILVAGALAWGAAPAFAHGIGGRYSLPVPLNYFLIGSAAVVAMSFVMIGIFVQERSSGASRYWRTDLLSARLLGPILASKATTVRLFKLPRYASLALSWLRRSLARTWSSRTSRQHSSGSSGGRGWCLLPLFWATSGRQSIPGTSRSNGPRSCWELAAPLCFGVRHGWTSGRHWSCSGSSHG